MRYNLSAVYPRTSGTKLCVSTTKSKNMAPKFKKGILKSRQTMACDSEQQKH